MWTRICNARCFWGTFKRIFVNWMHIQYSSGGGDGGNTLYLNYNCTQNKIVSWNTLYNLKIFGILRCFGIFWPLYSQLNNCDRSQSNAYGMYVWIQFMHDVDEKRNKHLRSLSLSFARCFLSPSPCGVYVLQLPSIETTPLSF